MKVEAAMQAHCRQKTISIEGILHARPQLPKVTTRGRGWSGITVDAHGTYLDCAESYPGLDHHLVTYCSAGRFTLTQSRVGVVNRSVICSGMSYIMPAGYDSTWEGDTGPTVRLRVPMQLMCAAAEELGRRSTPHVELRNVFHVRDPVIERLAALFASELDLKQHPAQMLIVDSLSTALAAHLLRSYDVFGIIEPVSEPALGKLELTKLAAYIEDNLERTIGLAEFAAVVNVSRFHFTRLFKRSTGYTAISFVEQCRIRRARELIAESDLPLAQIAIMTGFADQSHFTRRFHRHVGLTPAVFARDQGRRRSARQLLQ